MCCISGTDSPVEPFLFPASSCDEEPVLSPFYLLQCLVLLSVTKTPPNSCLLSSLLPFNTMTHSMSFSAALLIHRHQWSPSAPGLFYSKFFTFLLFFSFLSKTGGNALEQLHIPSWRQNFSNTKYDANHLHRDSWPGFQLTILIIPVLMMAVTGKFFASASIPTQHAKCFTARSCHTQD